MKVLTFNDKISLDTTFIQKHKSLKEHTYLFDKINYFIGLLVPDGNVNQGDVQKNPNCASQPTDSNQTYQNWRNADIAEQLIQRWIGIG